MLTLAKKRILVVDDDQAIVESIKDLLEAEGYSVDTASNGKEALDMLRARNLPNLILLDLSMPEMDGFEFRDEQEWDPRFSEIPVVVISANGQQFKDKIKEIQIRAYLKKPTTVDTLLDAVKRHCS